MPPSRRDSAMLLMAADVSQKLRTALDAGAVVGIVMVLVALTVGSMESLVIRAQLVEAYFLTSTVRGELVAHRAETGRWPSRGIAPEHGADGSEPLGEFADRIVVRDGGAIDVVFHDEKPAASLRGRTLTLRPLLASSEPGTPVAWACAAHRVPLPFVVSGSDATDIDPAHLPSACREY